MHRLRAVRLGWKVLIPGALVWIMLIATIRVWRRQGGSPGVYIVAGLIIAGLVALAWAWDVAEARRAKEAADIEAAEAEAEAAAGAYPVPALDLPHYHGIGVFAGGLPAASAENAGSAGNEVTGA